MRDASASPLKQFRNNQAINEKAPYQLVSAFAVYPGCDASCANLESAILMPGTVRQKYRLFPCDDLQRICNAFFAFTICTKTNHEGDCLMTSKRMVNLWQIGRLCRMLDSEVCWRYSSRV